ncbi:uncharacterized protein LOC122845272 [Gambusia affinis]|uniref:uncharacterized protein LOC122845272 n=1 Tax=Gambusia affinis TaxID=33528 RepID=UPI001CDBF3C6|nr:uncharacterized protein LOC122845272 [Gambusia affinis]
MTPPKERATCPICDYKFSCLGKHLTTRHFIKNKIERRLLINLGTGRVNFRHLSCPVPGCTFAKTRVDRHLEEGHPELDHAKIMEIIRDTKKQVTMDGLRALRASNPTPPVMSNLDIGLEHEEVVFEAADVVESTCLECPKLMKELGELRRLLKLKQRWAKRAKAKIQALEEALQKAGGVGGDSGESDLPCGQEATQQPEEDSSGEEEGEEEEASKKTSKKAISDTVAKVFRGFPEPILEFLDEFWVHLKGALGSKKQQENQRSKLGRIQQFLLFMSEGRSILPNWTFLHNVSRINEWPGHLHGEGKAFTTIKGYILNVGEFLAFFRDTPPSTSRVSKKSLVAVIRALSQILKALAKRVVLRQIHVKRKKAGKLIPKEDLHACQERARKAIPKLLDALETMPTPSKIRRFYGYISAYFASLYGHRTGVLTNMSVQEVEEAKAEAKPGDPGFVVNVKEHKTSKAFGPAQVYLTVEEFCWVEQWLAFREQLQTTSDLVFFNENHQRVKNLQTHLQGAWSEMGLPGSPTFMDFRTSIATYARNVLSPGTRTKISKSMCHNTDTAEKFYAMSQTTEQLAELRARFQEATDPDLPSGSDIAETPLLVLSESSSEDEGEGAGAVERKTSKELSEDEGAGAGAGAGTEAGTGAGAGAPVVEEKNMSEELSEDEGAGAGAGAGTEAGTGAGAGAPVVEEKNMASLPISNVKLTATWDNVFPLQNDRVEAAILEKEHSEEPVEGWESDHSYSKNCREESEDQQQASSAQDSPSPSPAEKTQPEAHTKEKPPASQER